MKNLLIVLGYALLISSCAKYPADSVTTEENDIIGSLYNQNTNFSSYSTFAIVDSVLLIKRGAGEPEPDTGYFRYSDRMISLISQNMVSRGYTRVSKDSTPDLGIDVSVLNDANIGSYTYWGGYPGYWGWYGYSYWYGWPSTTYYKYEIGTVVINMIDLQNRNDVDKELTVVWNNVAAGLVASSSNYNTSRIDRAINIMFEQSPYVKK
ncbi:MAG: hypothetical protein CL840_08755 [Crocinitomicaceae bacterium]|nr:hypothetical protein [Crocinitomicaceae bacterium]|tara:strand:+ start:48753 stop:49376 length:624 start_codon:yes stop_codon:yes gene_type:complete